MKKISVLLFILSLAVGASGCRISVNRLNKRIQRWESLKNKENSADRKAKFARETLYYFLSNEDFQRSKESLVSKAERLHFHQTLSDMQVFLIDYHASKALDLVDSSGDWKLGDLEWARADSLTNGLVACVKPTVYRMVLLQDGYTDYLSQISAEGQRYDRIEHQFPGVMTAFRKMSRYQFLKAGKLFEDGEWVEALNHYLLVFKRDTGNYATAERRVRYLSGSNIRQFYDRRFSWKHYIFDAYTMLRGELYDMAFNQVMNAQSELGDEHWTERLPDIWQGLAEKYGCTPEQAADIYYMLKHEREGTLPLYISLWRYDILKGIPPKLPDIVDITG